MPYKNIEDRREFGQRRGQAVKEWRARTKNKIIAAMGGCCQICGYFKCSQALELHHIDPSQKEKTISSLFVSPTNPSNYFDELRKCILLCSNCHREVHAGLAELPETYAKLDESYFAVKDICKVVPKKLAASPGLEPGT